MFVLLVEHA
jgi:hypothetical protein